MQLSVRELIGTARERFTSRDYYGALLCLEDLDGSARSYADVHHLRGLCLVMLERPDEALVEFDHALELNPRYVEAHLHRGLLLNNRGEQEAAAGAFASAAASERSPVAGVSGTVAARLANEHARLGDLYSEAGLSAEAIGQYKRAVELGKWGDGRKLTVEQKETCLAAMIAILELTHNPYLIFPSMLMVVAACLTTRWAFRCDGLFHLIGLFRVLYENDKTYQSRLILLHLGNVLSQNR